MASKFPLKVRSSTVVLRALIAFLFRFLTRLEISGLENVPARGGCLAVFNQLSNFDTALLFSISPRRDLTGLVAANYRARFFYRLVIEHLGGTWIRRGASDRHALETALYVLGEGWMVGISPEGRRSPTKALIEAKPGSAFLAARANVPILPVAVTNTEHLADAFLHLRRIPITVRFGKTFRLPLADSRNRKQYLQVASDVIMCHLAALLPQSYRGIYADNPYLKTEFPELSV